MKSFINILVTYFRFGFDDMVLLSNYSFLEVTKLESYTNYLYYLYDRYRNMISFKVETKNLPDGELNPGLPRDRRGYSPLYYRGFDIFSSNVVIHKNISQGFECLQIFQRWILKKSILLNICLNEKWMSNL